MSTDKQYFYFVLLLSLFFNSSKPAITVIDTAFIDNDEYPDKWDDTPTEIKNKYDITAYYGDDGWYAYSLDSDFDEKSDSTFTKDDDVLYVNSLYTKKYHGGYQKNENEDRIFLRRRFKCSSSYSSISVQFAVNFCWNSGNRKSKVILKEPQNYTDTSVVEETLRNNPEFLRLLDVQFMLSAGNCDAEVGWQYIVIDHTFNAIVTNSDIWAFIVGFYLFGDDKAFVYDIKIYCNQIVIPTESPTPSPTSSPTNLPTKSPTLPTASPTLPTNSPTKSPTLPTPSPTPYPTDHPTYSPTNNPTFSPTPEPTPSPTFSPTPKPTPKPNTDKIYIKPTSNPTETPTMEPTEEPTAGNDASQFDYESFVLYLLIAFGGLGIFFWAILLIQNFASIHISKVSDKFDETKLQKLFMDNVADDSMELDDENEIEMQKFQQTAVNEMKQFNQDNDEVELKSDDLENL